MASNATQASARELPWQMLHYKRYRVNYNDSGIATGNKMFRIPKDSNILFTIVKIRTAFNAGTTNVLTVGQNSTSYNDIVNSADVDESIAQGTLVMRGADLDLSSDEKDVYVKYTQTGGVATAGVADITVVYAPNNDQ